LPSSRGRSPRSDACAANVDRLYELEGLVAHMGCTDHERLCAANALTLHGAERERDEIVAWLRAKSGREVDEGDVYRGYALEDAADEIEGDHHHG
jgi:hypothetical protein